MHYLLSFIEGLITFISPCILPLLPVYLAYFLGGKQEKNNRELFKNTLSFIIGFSLVFILLGIFAGFIGGILRNYQQQVQWVTGGFVILTGFYFLDLFPSTWFQRKGKQRFSPTNLQGSFSFFLFGLVFALAWTPCLGAFLGSALALASQKGSMVEGALMLFSYSLGLGIPFMLSAFLLESLKGVFSKIKQHYQLINRISGGLLIVLGLLMASGLITKWQLLLL